MILSSLVEKRPLTRLRIPKKALSLPIPLMVSGSSSRFPDPVTTADKAASVLSILSSESSLCDGENQLMGAL